MKSTLLVAAGLALLSLNALAQLPPGVNMEAVNTVLPEEGAPKAVPGKYAVSSGTAFGNEGLRVFQPARFATLRKKDQLPIVVWGNGGCAMDNTRYNGFLETIASHGFLVITTAAPATVPAP